MLNSFLDFLASVSSGFGRSNEEKFAMTFFFVLMCATLCGLACILFLIFAAHGFYSGDELSAVTKDFKTSGTLGIVAMVSGYFASRWFREDTHFEKDEK